MNIKEFRKLLEEKQFGKIINIKYDEINNVKLSFSYCVRASYGIKIYDNNKKIMFEITSKVFDEFMKYCSDIEVKSKIESLLKEGYYPMDYNSSDKLIKKGT